VLTISPLVACKVCNKPTVNEDEVKEEKAPNVIDMFVAKVTSSSRFLTNFVSARITAIKGYFDEIFARKVNTKELCIGNTCVTEGQLQDLLNKQSAPATSSQTSTSSAETSSTTPSTVSIQINGDNPAVIEVGQSYNDLGATIDSLDSALKNLGIRTFVEDKEVSDVSIDTTKEGTHQVVYRVVDGEGEVLAEETRNINVIPVSVSSENTSTQSTQNSGSTDESNTATSSEVNL
jgi:hypothetical protein